MAMDDFERAVLEARVPRELSVGPITRLVTDVSSIPGAANLPTSLVILLENVIRRAQDDEDAVRGARIIMEAGGRAASEDEIEFMPSRVLFQDFTGVPVFVDFASMRDATKAAGGDVSRINPLIPCTLVIDHSVMADVHGCASAAEENHAIEAARNAERFAFLKWASQSFDNVEIVPPGQGICHQLNVERIASVAGIDALAEGDVEHACFDTVVGTDSHTTTVNGIGVLGWGVGGIEAEAAALGQPITMLVPPVVGLRMTGSLRDGVSGMDVALTVCEMLRAEGVVGSFVEAYGPGVSSLSATQRACIANMCPEYGATCVLFGVDDAVCDYLELTGRDAAEVAFVREFHKMQGTFGQGRDASFARVIELDLSSVGPCLAGPSRPHARVEIAGLAERFRENLAAHGKTVGETRTITCNGVEANVTHGAVAIAAITSCTTATDPAMMVAAGLTALHARERGLAPAPWVKTVLAPGSHATSKLLRNAGLERPLAELGFWTCGWGCMSCIGNSGEILDGLKAVTGELELASVLSGNRNFDGRISPDVAQNFLAQPALVVAYALCGTVDIDLEREPVGYADGKPVMLADILPSQAEIDDVLTRCLARELYLDDEGASAAWDGIEVHPSETFDWDESSTYVRNPPYFEIATRADVLRIEDAHALAVLGDFVTTDHISPAGKIASGSPAALYLEERGVAEADFNSYGARRGNHEVMQRGTFANIRLENKMAKGKVGGYTTSLSGEVVPIWDAAAEHMEAGDALVVLAGKMYGSGSSRDWAAKGPLLQGVRAVIAESFERIHRSNLIGMGILPLEFAEGESVESLGLTGEERFDIDGISVGQGLPEPGVVQVRATAPDGSTKSFACTVRIDTKTEGAYMSHGGILPFVLSRLQ